MQQRNAVSRLDCATGHGTQEKGNANVAWWVTASLGALGTGQWAKVGLRQLSGMLVLVFARTDLMVGLLSPNPKTTRESEQHPKTFHNV